LLTVAVMSAPAAARRLVAGRSMNVQLKYQPHARQMEAHRCPAKFILFGGATEGGKSCWLVNDALMMALAWSGNRVGIYRWEYETFMKTTYVTMEEWLFSVPGLVVQHNQNRKEIRLANGSVIIYGGLKPSSAVSGDMFSTIRSLELGAIYIDEVTDVPEKVYSFLATRVQRVTGENIKTGRIERIPMRICASCNPEPGWVKQRWVDQKLPDHKFIPSKLTDNPHRADDREETLRTQFQHIPGWEERYIDGSWNTATAPNILIPPLWISRTYDLGFELGDPVELGVDVAAWGDDKSVIFLRRGRVGEIVWSGGQIGTTGTEDVVKKAYDDYNPRSIKVDSIGVGQGVFDHLARDGYPVIAMIGGAKPTIPGFANIRSQWYWELRRLLEDKAIQLPRDNGLANDLGTIKYDLGGNGKTITVHSKQTIKRKLGRSPDFGDACVYCFAGAGTNYIPGKLFGSERVRE